MVGSQHFVRTFLFNVCLKPLFVEFILTGYADPFTGGARYVPGSSNDYQSSSGNVDPFTGASSYSTGSNPALQVNFTPRSGQNLDPFTGASSHTTASAKSTSSKHFPYTQYILIDACDPSKVLDKLK